MDFGALASARRSIRGYKNDPVPKLVLQGVVEIAKNAASSMNTRPWYMHIVAGEPQEPIHTGHTENRMAGIPPKPDRPMKEAYEGLHRQRQVDVANQLFEAIGIARDDKKMRTD